MPSLSAALSRASAKAVVREARFTFDPAPTVLKFFTWCTRCFEITLSRHLFMTNERSKETASSRSSVLMRSRAPVFAWTTCKKPSRKALAKQQSAEQALAALDQKATEEKTNALAENDKLRADVASGARRLRIAGSCSAGGDNVSGTTAGSSVGDASTVELSPASGSTVLSIRAGIIADRAALKALQSYVMNVCRQGFCSVGRTPEYGDTNRCFWGPCADHW